jgi:hypothetical protein
MRSFISYAAFVLAAGCGSSSSNPADAVPSDTRSSDAATAAPEWSVVASPVEGATWMSLWGTGPDNIWMVGHDPPFHPLIAHYDGTTWTQVPSPTREEGVRHYLYYLLSGNRTTGAASSELRLIGLDVCPGERTISGTSCV